MIYPNLQKIGISVETIYKETTAFRKKYNGRNWKESLPLLVEANRRDHILFQLNKELENGLFEPVM